jgi:hypothetical protein
LSIYDAAKAILSSKSHFIVAALGAQTAFADRSSLQVQFALAQTLGSLIDEVDCCFLSNSEYCPDKSVTVANLVGNLRTSTDRYENSRSLYTLGNQYRHRVSEMLLVAYAYFSTMILEAFFVFV